MSMPATPVLDDPAVADAQLVETVVSKLRPMGSRLPTVGPAITPLL
jgi:hypothetical protein